MDNWTVVDGKRLKALTIGLEEAIADLEFIAAHDQSMSALARSAAEVAKCYLREAYGTASIK